MFTTYMDISGVLEYANEKGFGLDGFDLRAMFPGKTNWRELEGAQDSSSPTWQLLKLQIRRWTLEGIFCSMRVYGAAPAFWGFDPVRAILKLVRGTQNDPLRYRERVCNVNELDQFVEGPRIVAVALDFDHVSPPQLGDEPQERELADGSREIPTAEDLQDYERSRILALEQHLFDEDKASDKFVSRASRVIEWASLTPSIKTLLLFERTGKFAFERTKLVYHTKKRLASVPQHKQRRVQCSFPENTPGIEEDGLQVILMDAENFIGSPDLFISFDSSTNGFPLCALAGSAIFTPHRRQLLAARKIELLDFVEAIKFYVAS